jgi:hypothetical protein
MNTDWFRKWLCAIVICFVTGSIICSVGSVLFVKGILPKNIIMCSVEKHLSTQETLDIFAQYGTGLLRCSGDPCTIQVTDVCLFNCGYLNNSEINSRKTIDTCLNANKLYTRFENGKFSFYYRRDLSFYLSLIVLGAAIMLTCIIACTVAAIQHLFIKFCHSPEQKTDHVELQNDMNS